MNHKNICIEGVIGVGKTSLSSLLSERFSARTVLESVEENPFLSKFYEDRTAFAFQTQLWFLLSRYRQITDEMIQQNLFHEVVISDYLFAKDRIFATINLDDNELALYDSIAKLLEARVVKPDLVIYLQASTDVLMKRIHKRSRPYEAAMDRKYIESLNEAYNHFFFHYTDSALLIINTSELDFVANDGDLEEIIGQIRQTRSGINYYQPLRREDRMKIAGGDNQKQ
jgi:deoxyadenosine/deoxycytidine kinase